MGLIFLLIFLVFLTHSELTVKYAFIGLDTWYRSMVPTLFPFLFLLNFLLLNQLTESFLKPVSRILKPVFRLSDACLFVIFFGFLGGFPLGAKCGIDLYRQGKISRPEAEYLLAFTNNLGPAYLTGFVYHRILCRDDAIISLPVALFFQFGIPLLYGLCLRYTIYKHIPSESVFGNASKLRVSSSSAFLGRKKQEAHEQSRIQSQKQSQKQNKSALISSLPKCLGDSLYQIGLLGGYMILFNALRVLPDLLLRRMKPFYIISQSLLEVSGGLLCLSETVKSSAHLLLFSFATLSFGGLSCFFQTLSLLEGSGLSGQKYMLHKIILCSITSLLVFFYVLIN